MVEILNDYTGFSDAIFTSYGKIELLAENHQLFTLEKLLARTSEKIHLLLSNRAFVVLEAELRCEYKSFLRDYYNAYIINLEYLKKLYKTVQNGQQSKVLIVSFLGITVWLRVYMFFYSMALEKDDQDVPVLQNIHRSLSGTSPEISTLQLYALKNLRLNNNTSLKDIQTKYKDTKVHWIKYMLNQRSSNNQTNIIPLVPSDDKEFLSGVDALLNEIFNLDLTKVNIFIDLCDKSKNNYNQLLCIYSWFIRFYKKYSEMNHTVDQKVVRLLEEHKETISLHLGEIGYKLILLLITNFTVGSFLQLKQRMTVSQVYLKLVVVSIMVSFIAQRCLDSGFSSFLFENRQFPKDFVAHLNKHCLFGQHENNSIITNMRDVKRSIEQRLRENKIRSDAKLIYKCSSKCDYLFFFKASGIPNDRSVCKECGSDIGAVSYNKLLKRNNGFEQIAMTIDGGLKYIDEHLQTFEGQNKKGYFRHRLEDNNKADKKSKPKPITFRTLHLLLHATIFGLSESGLITTTEVNRIVDTNQNIHGKGYFEDHFRQDYRMVEELIGTKEAYIWIYQALLSMNKVVDQKGAIKDSRSLNNLEKTFEETVVDPMIVSASLIIQSYHRNYAQYNKYLDHEDISLYVDELKENQERFPFLRYFSFLKLPTFKDFNSCFLLLKDGSKALPLLDLVLKKHRELSNISSLPGIVDFTNILMKKYKYEISKDEAYTTTLREKIKDDSFLRSKYLKFEADWNKLKIETVHVYGQEKKFHEINADYNLSTFLLSTHKDESGNLLVGTMISLANLQNEFIYATKVANNPNKSLETIVQEERTNLDIIQTIRTDQVIDISKDRILSEITHIGYTHNYEYGRGREIIYDFQEIENKLHQYASGIKILNEEKLILMNYKLDIYSESASVLLDIRRKNTQESLTPDNKSKYKYLLHRFSKKDLIAYLNSLDYVFAYLRSKKEDGGNTIAGFCQAEILDYQSVLSEHVFKKQPLSAILIKHVADLYETLEEVIFDEIFRPNIQNEFVEKIPEDEALTVTEIFRQNTIESKNPFLYPKLRQPQILAKVFKRLLLRILLSQVNLENSLLDYLTREDMWEEGTELNEIYNMEFDGRIKLKHAYVVLKDIESRLLRLDQNETEKKEQN